MEKQSASSAPHAIPRQSHECVFPCPSSWASLTQLRNFERPLGSFNSTDNGQQLYYNYIPTQWVCITFLTLFGVSTCKVPSASSTYRRSQQSLFGQSFPPRTSDPFTFLVAISQCNFMWRSRTHRLERSTMVESRPVHRHSDTLYHSVSKLRGPRLSLC